MSQLKKLGLQIFFLFGSFVTALLALMLLAVFYIAFYSHKIIRALLSVRWRFDDQTPHQQAKDDMTDQP